MKHNTAAKLGYDYLSQQLGSGPGIALHCTTHGSGRANHDEDVVVARERAEALLRAPQKMLVGRFASFARGITAS